MAELLKKAHRRLVLDQSGSVLIEALVSGTLLVIVSIGVLGGFESANRASSEERHRARAQWIAQEDLARMRAMSISTLSSFGTQTRTVSQQGTPYTVKSETEFLTDTTSEPDCTPGTSSADYIRITSTVTWPTIGSRPAVKASSLVAPPAGSISANSGALAVSVQDAGGIGTPGVGVTGSGAGSFSGTTGPKGCIIFGNIPAGNYSVNLTGLGSSLVDVDGNPPSARTTSVVAESTNTLVLQYDSPGELPVQFTTRNYSGNVVPSTADGVVAFNTGMTNSRIFTNPTQVSEIQADGLFPFTSPYTVYAGRCIANNPTAATPTAPAAAGSATVPAGGTAPTTTVQLPAMLVTVYTGTSTASTRASGATVRFLDNTCGGFFGRNDTTNASGQLPDPGLPYGSYYVCATNGSRRVQLSVPMNNKSTTASNPNPLTTTSGTGWAASTSGLNIFLGSGTATTAPCS